LLIALLAPVEGLRGCLLYRGGRAATAPGAGVSCPMSKSGIVTLGQMAALFADADLRMVEVACNRCPRRSRLSIARLLAEHGPARQVPSCAASSPRTCPRMQVQRTHDPCGARRARANWGHQRSTRNHTLSIFVPVVLPSFCRMRASYGRRPYAGNQPMHLCR
jgi:hypothetical protein